jgi:hypothetical protein
MHLIPNLRWLAAVLLINCAAAASRAAEWLPPTAQELQMTVEPLAPKASAILLYRQVDRDDTISRERNYLRIKILTDEGRSYANVELGYDSRWENIEDIEARMIRPDGSILPFSGTIFEKEVVESTGIDHRAKAFALADVQVGSIIEYRFTRQLRVGSVFNSQWILSEPLFTRDAKFSLQPNRRFSLRFSWPQGLPEGTLAPVFSAGAVRLETHNVPAFIKEDHMPPENELRYRVDFIYVAGDNLEKDPKSFWEKFGKTRFKSVEEFVDQRRVMQQALAQIVSPDDSPETKLHKLYARVQELRNLSFEPRKSGQEKDREHQEEHKDAAEVWQSGYGTSRDLTWLFLGLVRAAGLHADPVLVANRDAVFFKVSNMNPGQLNNSLVLVTDAGKEIYLDPGAAFIPYGMLPWGKTGVVGLVLDKAGGRWVDTPMPAPADSRIERTANLQLTSSGDLTGRVTLEFTGLEARACRLHERNEDEAHRQRYLESLLKLDVPNAVQVTVVKSPDWIDSQAPVVAEYDVTMPDWATLTGQRALIPVGVFSGRGKHLFEHAARIHPVYFAYPFEYSDDVRIALPAGWSAASLPSAHDTNVNALAYQAAATYGDGTLQLTRKLTSKVTLLDVKYYDTVREFFQSVRTGDADQVVVSASATNAAAKAPARATATASGAEPAGHL